MPAELRSKLLEGDFLAGREDHEWQVIPTEWVVAAQERWKSGTTRGRMDTIGVDVAQGGADNAALAPFYGVRLIGSIYTRASTRRTARRLLHWSS
jgi:hypothetical protein